MRANRTRYKNRSREAQIKENCRSHSHYLLKTGVIQKKPCQLCKSEYSEMHHPNYRDPRNVEWYCRRCHRSMHKNGFLEGKLEMTTD